ncbi:hypothetical protein ACA910_017251 [Epithemia clementina (nom. ined.)]
MAFIVATSLQRASFCARAFSIQKSRWHSRLSQNVRTSASASASSSHDGEENKNSFSFSNSTIATALENFVSNGATFTRPPSFDASATLSVDPSEIRVQQLSPKDNEDFFSRQSAFVSMFRGSAKYIANHRNTLGVYHIPGGLLDLPDHTVFRDLMQDIAITWLLGMQIVLVVGCRHQIRKRLGDINRGQGLCVTDRETLQIVKEEAGSVRFEVERQLARCLRVQGAAPLGGGGHAAGLNGYYDGNVVSGNFYSSQPFGILDGIDYQYSGFLRKVEVEKIRQLHNNRDICLLTSLGVSPSGEVFNVNSECLAAGVGGALGASKVIYFTENDMELRHMIHEMKIQSLRLSDATALLRYHGVKCHKQGYVTIEDESAAVNGPRDVLDMLIRIGWGTRALELGVKRAHIISPRAGAVLQELFTRDGNGVLVSGDIYEGIRRAIVQEVAEIYDLIQPLVESGKLIYRPKATLEHDIDTYYVYTRDSHIVACGQLKLFEDGFAEIGCLVVSKDYRHNGRGDAMLGYLERLALMNGCRSIFVLSTQTMEWFLERGFDAATVDQLPKSRQATYNHLRASKIYIKKIETPRDLDASELWWNR